MKIKIKEFVDNDTMLSHMILNCINDAATKTITSIENRTEDTEIDVDFKINGVELDIREFTKILEKSWSDSIKRSARLQAVELFEEFKHKYKSENSTNSKLEKIRKQIEKANNQLINISNNIDNLNINES